MRVYSKNENNEYIISIISRILIIILFLLFSVGSFIPLVISNTSVVELLASPAIIFYVFPIAFFIVDIYTIYSLFKRPKGYIVKLLSKKVESYKGNIITYMVFSATTSNKKIKFECYTKEENDLVVGNNYILKIKEFNWEPKYIEKLYYNQTNNNVSAELPTIKMFPVFLLLVLFFGGMLFWGIIGIIENPNYRFLFFVLDIILLFFIYVIFKTYKMWKNDNNPAEENNHINSKLKTIKPLESRIIKLSSIDKKLIKKYSISIKQDIDITNIHRFSIIRTSNMFSFNDYFIVDKNNILLFRIRRAGLLRQKKYIYNQNNVKIGEISFGLLNNNFNISLVNEKPFIVHSKLQLGENYQVLGRDYYVEGDYTKNIIFDNNRNEIAYIIASSKKDNNWINLGNSVVFVDDDINNNIDLIFISLCVTIGNLYNFNINN